MLSLYIISFIFTNTYLEKVSRRVSLPSIVGFVDEDELIQCCLRIPNVVLVPSRSSSSQHRIVFLHTYTYAHSYTYVHTHARTHIHTHTLSTHAHIYMHTDIDMR